MPIFFSLSVRSYPNFYYRTDLSPSDFRKGIFAYTGKCTTGIYYAEKHRFPFAFA